MGSGSTIFVWQMVAGGSANLNEAWVKGQGNICLRLCSGTAFLQRERQNLLLRGGNPEEAELKPAGGVRAPKTAFGMRLSVILSSRVPSKLSKCELLTIF